MKKLLLSEVIIQPVFKWYDGEGEVTEGPPTQPSAMSRTSAVRFLADELPEQVAALEARLLAQEAEAPEEIQHIPATETPNEE